MELSAFFNGLLLTVSLLQLTSARVDNFGGWNNAPDTQYHIQTDEGEERYFKYQTRSGQYRKERRLNDGTVIGTYGWVDPNGYLRLRDYIADNAGYRILKSKMVFVGDNSDVGNAVTAAKNVPPTAGELVSHRNSPFNNYLLSPTRTVFYQNYVPGSTPASTIRLFPTSTPSPIFYHSSSTPLVDIHPNSVPKTVYISSTLTPPAQDHTPRPIAVYSTPSPVAVNYISSTTEEPTSDILRPVINRHNVGLNGVTTASPISVIGYTASPERPPESALPPISGKFASPVNNFITETEKNKLFLKHEDGQGYYKKRYVDYKSNDQDYDGISTVQNGFRYFLPKQYHEELSSADGQDRTGSFGYVDPFGIRRVIYYNTSPEKGFVHRKNNRYVGFNAAPYDPRPT